jgi:hypothetical protein
VEEPIAVEENRAPETACRAGAQMELPGYAAPVGILLGAVASSANYVLATHGLTVLSVAVRPCPPQGSWTNFIGLTG